MYLQLILWPKHAKSNLKEIMPHMVKGNFIRIIIWKITLWYNFPLFLYKWLNYFFVLIDWILYLIFHQDIGWWEGWGRHQNVSFPGQIFCVQTKGSWIFICSFSGNTYHLLNVRCVWVSTQFILPVFCHLLIAFNALIKQSGKWRLSISEVCHIFLTEIWWIHHLNESKSEKSNETM